MNEQEHRTLLDIARHTIENGVNRGESPRVNGRDYDGTLADDGACFVTLQINGRLRGCIGSLEAHRPLIEDCAENAFSAAFSDPRFPPVGPAELEQLDIHISVLTRPEPFPVSSEQDLLARLRPGTDGLVLKDGYHRATFLPSVWAQLPAPADFLAHLKRKAGLPADYWSSGMRFERYTVEEFS